MAGTERLEALRREVDAAAAQRQADALRMAQAGDFARADRTRRYADVLAIHVGFIDGLVDVVAALERDGAEWKLEEKTVGAAGLPRITITTPDRFGGGEFRFSQYDSAEAQISAWARPDANAAWRAADMARRIGTLGCSLTWLLERLPGVSPKKAKTLLLAATGYVSDGDLTHEGATTGFFIPRSQGRFARWVDLTVDGTMWVLSRYEAGDLGCAPAPLPEDARAALAALRARQETYLAAEATLTEAGEALAASGDATTLSGLRARRDAAGGAARAAKTASDNYVGGDNVRLDGLRRFARDAAVEAADYATLSVLAEGLEQRGAPWTTDGLYAIEAPSPHDGRPYRFTVFEDAESQLAAFDDPALATARRHSEIGASLDVAHKLKWVFERLPGVKYNLARTRVLFDSGLAGDGDGDVTLTEEGRASGLLVERAGQYGAFIEVTPKGMAWIIDLYRAGELPAHRKSLGEPAEDLVALADMWRAYAGEDATVPPAQPPVA